MLHINKNFVFGAIMTALLYGGFVYLGHNPNLWQTVFLFLLSYPWSDGKNVYSLWGGFGEGNVYSLCGIVQVAGGNAWHIIGISLYQSAGGEAVQLIGISLYQSAGKDASCVIGISFYQCSEDDVLLWFGISFCQTAKHDIGMLVGISLYSFAGKDILQFVGISFSQVASRSADLIVGISLYRRAKHCVDGWSNITMLQRVIPE